MFGLEAYTKKEIIRRSKTEIETCFELCELEVI